MFASASHVRNKDRFEARRRAKCFHNRDVRKGLGGDGGSQRGCGVLAVGVPGNVTAAQGAGEEESRQRGKQHAGKPRLLGKGDDEDGDEETDSGDDGADLLGRAGLDGGDVAL